MPTNNAINEGTGTAGQIPLGQSVGTAAVFTTPTVGTGLSLTSNSTTMQYGLTIPVATTSGGSGSTNFQGNLTLLNTQTASSSASLVLTGMTGYLSYELDFYDIACDTHQINLQIQYSTDGGSTWVTTNYEYMGYYLNSSGTGGFTSAQSQSVFLISNNQYAGTSQTCNAKLYVYGNSTSGALKYGTLLSVFPYYLAVGSNVGAQRVTGYRIVNTSVMNAVKVFPSAGLMTSGTVKLFGVNS